MGNHDPENGTARLRHIPGWAVLVACLAVASAILAVGTSSPFPEWVLAAETLVTIVGLFVFGSSRIRINKNALAYGMMLVILASFWRVWWPGSPLRARVDGEGWTAFLAPLRRQLLTWHGLDHLVHLDTMLFILGLTLFVAVIAQSRLLEAIAFGILRRCKGRVLPTMLAITAAVALASGILDGVSMIGLAIRTIVLILFLARAPVSAVRYSVVVCTVVTTVCGVWLAYGEPPNLIMKSNLVTPDGRVLLTNTYFLKFCLPVAVAGYLVIAWNLRRRIGPLSVKFDQLDILDAHADRLRFLQATKHGEVISAVETVRKHREDLGEEPAARVIARERRGEPLGTALIRESVPEPVRVKILGHFVEDELAATLDRHYALAEIGDEQGARRTEVAVAEELRSMVPRLRTARRFGIAGLVLFIAVLFAHALEHRIPLFVASFAGFFVSILGISSLPRMWRLSLREARHEYAEYCFLFPLFLSMALLNEVGFFAHLQAGLRQAADAAGTGPVAFLQFAGCTLLSALLDNNVVADFGSHAIRGIEAPVVLLYATAQIAGYAVGGCWTHIGSAQSVVAYSYLRKDVDAQFTPMQWIREMTPVVLEVLVAISAILLAQSLLLGWLG